MPIVTPINTLTRFLRSALGPNSQWYIDLFTNDLNPTPATPFEAYEWPDWDGYDFHFLGPAGVAQYDLVTGRAVMEFPTTTWTRGAGGSATVVRGCVLFNASSDEYLYERFSEAIPMATVGAEFRFKPRVSLGQLSS